MYHSLLTGSVRVWTGPVLRRTTATTHDDKCLECCQEFEFIVQFPWPTSTLWYTRKLWGAVPYYEKWSVCKSPPKVTQEMSKCFLFNSWKHNFIMLNIQYTYIINLPPSSWSSLQLPWLEYVKMAYSKERKKNTHLIHFTLKYLRLLHDHVVTRSLHRQQECAGSHLVLPQSGMLQSVAKIV